jgi:hypothetical protein
MTKKNTVILIVIVAVLVLALGIFLLFFTSPNIQAPAGQSTNSPFGNYTGSSPTTQSSSTTEATTGEGETAQYINNPSSPLIKISTVPIAGAEAFDRKVLGTTTVGIVRYMERATGHTAEYDRSTGVLSTVSNTTIPSIYEAKWSGNTVLAQFLDQDKNIIKTFTGSLSSTATSSTTTPTTALIGGFLTSDIYALAISPKGNRVFTLPKGKTAVGSISNLDGTKKTSILSFPFNEWVTEWPSESTVTLTTKPSFSTSGFMYFLSTTGTMTKALGNITGLTTRTSPSLGYTIYSASGAGSISTGVYDFKKNTTFAFTGSQTFPEKCVWSKLSKTTAYCAVPTTIPTGSYPDDWYQGSVSFVDNIYKVDLSLPAVQLLYKLPADQSIDAINLFLDPKEENLYFTNKSDYYLWGLTIKSLSPIDE